MHIKPVLTFLLMLLGVQLMAQSVLISGKILDENGEEVPGVSILLKGTSRGGYFRY